MMGMDKNEDIYYTVESQQHTDKSDLKKANGGAGFPFDASKAYAVRLKAFANGAIYAIEHIPDVQNRAGAIDKIKALTQKKLDEIPRFKKNPAPSGKVLFHELDEFNNQLAKASGLKRKSIALGEAFWAWQVYERPQTRETTFTTDDGLIITQTETLLESQLTDDQKRELMTIHGDKPGGKPKWFLKLDDWAQSALKDIVPTGKQVADTDDSQKKDLWKNYQKTIPATLRHIPGQSNATKHTLKIAKKDGTVISESVAYKQGVPTAFEMPKENTAKSAKDNLQQMLDGLDATRENVFKSYWKMSDTFPVNQLSPPPVLLGGLLTPKEQGGYTSNFLDRTGLSGKENNSRFADEKTAALDAYKSKPGVPNSNIFNLNVAINNQRSSNPAKVDTAFLGYAIKLHPFLRDELRQANPKGQSNINLVKEQTQKISMLNAAIKALETHDANNQLPGRNKNLHLAALYDVTTRLMGGCSTGNCKSSKDRKGVELMMADAMMIYYNQYKEFPRHDETDPQKRVDFIKIFVSLYNSGHQLLIAHDNSPGSAGIKDEGILDKDIKEALGGKKPGSSYLQSKEIADFNKPQSFFDKHNKKIQPVLSALAIIATAATVILLATGVLAPAALITGALAVNLGAGPIVAGIASGIGAAFVSAAAAGLAYFGIERYMNRDKGTQTLEAQGLLRPKITPTEKASPAIYLKNNTSLDSELATEEPKVRARAVSFDSYLVTEEPKVLTRKGGRLEDHWGGHNTKKVRKCDTDEQFRGLSLEERHTKTNDIKPTRTVSEITDDNINTFKPR